ncbi:hypothetical protein BH09PSE6_BH09PSE6_28380 [soil metagenome]
MLRGVLIGSCVGGCIAMAVSAHAGSLPLPGDVKPKGSAVGVVHAKIVGKFQNLYSDEMQQALANTCQAVLHQQIVFIGDAKTSAQYTNDVYRSPIAKVTRGEFIGTRSEGPCKFITEVWPVYKLEALEGDGVRLEELDERVGLKVRHETSAARVAAFKAQSPAAIMAALPAGVSLGSPTGAREALGYKAMGYRRAMPGGFTHDYVLLDDPKAPARIQGAMVESHTYTANGAVFNEWKIIELDADAEVDAAVFDRPADVKLQKPVESK